MSDLLGISTFLTVLYWIWHWYYQKAEGEARDLVWAAGVGTFGLVVLTIIVRGVIPAMMTLTN